MLIYGYSAVSTARSEVGISHRDVSKSNVMMAESRDDPQGRTGILNDWDHAKQVGTPRVDWIRLRTVCISTKPSLASLPDSIPQACWQFISVALLANPTKPHDIFDDLESLYWVLLYVAVALFLHEGKLPESLFDEIYDQPAEFIGRISHGGEIKESWLETPKISFKSAQLEEVLTNYRSFFDNYENKVAHNEVYKQELDEIRENPQESIEELLSYFDDVLHGDENDWEDSAAIGVPPKPQRPNARSKMIRRSVHHSVTKGLWRGASGWKRPTTVPASEPDQAEEEPAENGGALGTIESAVGGESISFILPPIEEDHEDDVKSSSNSEDVLPPQQTIAHDVSERRILRPRPAAVTRR